MQRKTSSSSSTVGVCLQKGLFFSFKSFQSSAMNLKQFPKRLDSKTSCLRITVPENLDLALEGLIRKVLREQPKTDDIYSFAANYFETLLKIRDKAGTNFAVGQLCPFHNDEDAHEMIKIAGTFPKPEKITKIREELSSTNNRVEKPTKKDVKRSKPKPGIKDRKTVKQSTPDLIKKLPNARVNRLEMEKTNLDVKKPETIDEKGEVDGEFLTSDPIKELVEKELMEEKVKVKEEVLDVESVKEQTPDEKVSQGNKELVKNDEVETNTKEDEAKEKTSGVTPESLQNTQTADDSQIPAQKINKDDDKQENKDVRSPTEVENTAETVNVIEQSSTTAKEEKQQLQDSDKREESEKSSQSQEKTAEDEHPSRTVPEEDNATLTTELNNGHAVETPKQEKKMQNATVEQQPETEIDKETKATDENIAITALPVGGDSSLTNPPYVTSKEVDETIIKDEDKEGVEGIKNEREDSIRGDEEQTKTAEDKETEHENEKKPLKSTEEKNEIENVGLETPKDGLADEEKKADAKTDEKNEKVESYHLDEAKPKETEEKPSDREGELETEPESKTEDSKEIEKDRISQTAEEPKMEVQNKPTEEPNSEKELSTVANSQKDETETIQPEVDGKTEPEELCTVVDVLNIPEKTTEKEKSNQAQLQEMEVDTKLPKEDESDESKTNQTENGILETEKTQKVEEQTNQEVVDVKNIPKVETTDESETKTNEAPVGERNTEESSTVVGVGNRVEEKQTGSADNKKEEEIPQNEEKTNPEELCTVVDINNIPKELTADESGLENKKEEHTTQEIEQKTPKEDAFNENISEKPETNTPKEEKDQNKDDTTIPDELCTVVDVENIPKEDKTNEKTTPEETTQSVEDKPKPEEDVNPPNEETASESKPAEVEPPHIVEPEKRLNTDAVQPPEEVQIKTIQAHYYDTLKVPETVTKEYIVHNVATPPITSLLGVTNLLPRTIDENTNAPPPIGFADSANASPPPEKQLQADITETQQEVESNPQTNDSDDLLDILTPTSGYSLNLSELSWPTVSGMFLDSERRYSSLEKEEVKYTTPNLEDQTRQEVEEVIHKTVIPTGVDAVPVPPRDAEEINAEEVPPESVKEKKEEKPEAGSEGSTESRSVDSDVPFISVEVKTVIETQLLDEEEKDGERRQSSVEVTVEATIDIQDDVGMPQSEPDSIEEENKISNGINQKVSDLKSSLEDHKTASQDENQKESSSTEQTTTTTGKDGSSGESYSTVSSAPTEIKRTDSAKRNFSSTRSLLSTQSLDLGKRNPLVKTRSLSTFRHGVTDFEIWSAIEKELEEAATKIQSKFRGYKTRKKLQRENAVQITTEESSPSTTPAEIEVKEEGQQSTGEFHDSIVLAEHPR